MEKRLKSGRGGKRDGSGRKPEPDKKLSYNTKLRPDQIEWLRSQYKAAAILEKLIDNEMQNNAEGGLKVNGKNY